MSIRGSCATTTIPFNFHNLQCVTKYCACLYPRPVVLYFGIHRGSYTPDARAPRSSVPACSLAVACGFLSDLSEPPTGLQRSLTKVGNHTHRFHAAAAPLYRVVGIRRCQGAARSLLVSFKPRKGGAGMSSPPANVLAPKSTGNFQAVAANCVQPRYRQDAWHTAASVAGSSGGNDARNEAQFTEPIDDDASVLL